MSAEEFKTVVSEEDAGKISDFMCDLLPDGAHFCMIVAVVSNDGDGVYLNRVTNVPFEAANLLVTEYARNIEAGDIEIVQNDFKDGELCRNS